MTDAQKLIALIEATARRKLTPQEIALALEQARALGEF
jgi:hypothetical protein